MFHPTEALFWNMIPSVSFFSGYYPKETYQIPGTGHVPGVCQSHTYSQISSVYQQIKRLGIGQDPAVVPKARDQWTTRGWVSDNCILPDNFNYFIKNTLDEEGIS